MLLAKYRFNLDDANTGILFRYLCPVITDNVANAYEEILDSGLTHLLRTSLAKSGREKANIAQPLSEVTNIKKVFKHIQSVIDRLKSGLRPIPVNGNSIEGNNLERKEE